VGEYFRVTWRDGKTCVPAEIIERRPLRDQQPKKGKAAVSAEQPAEGEEATAPAEAKAADLEYYVHYVDYDRRLDEWVKVDRVDLQAGPQTVAPEAAGHGHHGGTSKKRKLDETGGHEGGNVPNVGAVMKEHEEITKVKNIHCIELGRHEVETWYYSPFPQEYCHKVGHTGLINILALLNTREPSFLASHLRVV
jgi:histone acetyltransferase MYST1